MCGQCHRVVLYGTNIHWYCLTLDSDSNQFLNDNLNADVLVRDSARNKDIEVSYYLVFAFSEPNPDAIDLDQIPLTDNCLILSTHYTPGIQKISRKTGFPVHVMWSLNMADVFLAISQNLHASMPRYVDAVFPKASSQHYSPHSYLDYIISHLSPSCRRIFVCLLFLSQHPPRKRFLYKLVFGVQHEFHSRKFEVYLTRFRKELAAASGGQIVLDAKRDSVKLVTQGY